ncbi:glycosyltransferase [Cohnella sp. GCM10027633]|uniref:CgeB family protein n=1 Tax=unclassified Cohnella TaxID=2636738 RepID=UPI003639B178
MRRHRQAISVRDERAAAFRDGWIEGWRLGACRRIDQSIVPANGPIRAARVLYVPQGFEAIDQGIVEALRANVSEVIVGSNDGLRRQAEQFRPDVVVVLNGVHLFAPDYLEQLGYVRRMGIPTVVWFVDDPYVTDDTVKLALHYDYVFTHERSCVRLYRSIGCEQVHHLPLAAHFGTFRPMPTPRAYESDICFIGTGFPNRIALFDRLAPYLQDKRVVIAGGLWDRMRHYRSIERFLRKGGVAVPESAYFYNGAKIVINLHRMPGLSPENRNALDWPAESINPRTFDMSACGTLQLTDERSELREMYAVGSELGVYRDANDLIEQIDYYLTHEAERLIVAAKGYRRTRTQHTFDDRITKMLDIVGFPIMRAHEE